MSSPGARASILEAGGSPAVLEQRARRPRFALKRRPPAFHDAFEDRVLFYDCFRHHDGQRVLLVGPPPVNLDYSRIVVEAGGSRLNVRFHVSRSVSIAEVEAVPEAVHELRVRFAGETFALAIQPSACPDLAGRRLIFTINRDNDLGWIREWALWHARNHGADAAVVVDNGSTTYSPADIAETLAGVPGMARVAVPSWPHRFGPVDPAVFNNPYWSRFLQIGSMSMVLRRYGMGTAGMLDCDVDELAVTNSGRSVFDLARESRGGLIAFRGRWVEAVAESGSSGTPPHRHYRQLLADRRRSRSRPRKWALDPSRDWVQRLSVHPYWHWIEGRPRGAKTMSNDASYRHFRAISTNWKRPPAAAPRGDLERDPVLDRGFAGLPL